MLGDTLALLVALFILTAIAITTAQPRKPLRGTQCLGLLRRRLLCSPTLQSRHPDVVAVLRSWRLRPSHDHSRADMDGQTLHIVVHGRGGRLYDTTTLTLVLVHELTHAALGSGAHDEAFLRAQSSCVDALVADGLLRAHAQPDITYPAYILDMPQV